MLSYLIICIHESFGFVRKQSWQMQAFEKGSYLMIQLLFFYGQISNLYIGNHEPYGLRSKRNKTQRRNCSWSIYVSTANQINSLFQSSNANVSAAFMKTQ